MNEVTVSLTKDEVYLIQWLLARRDMVPGYRKVAKSLNTSLGLKMLQAMFQLKGF